MLDEEWRAVPGYPPFEVSDQGNVRRTDGREVNPRPNRDTGYLEVSVRIDGKSRNRRVHTLVMLAFEGPRPEGLEVAHSNGVQTDNRKVNLAYKTHAENEADKVLHGTTNRGERHGRHVLTLEQVNTIRQRKAAGELCRIIAADMGVNFHTAKHVYYGHKWVNA